MSQGVQRNPMPRQNTMPSSQALATVTGGHVSMMNDVLISQLPADALRSVLRTLVASSHTNAAVFSSAVRTYLGSNPPNAPDPSTLFDRPETVAQLLADARICFAAHRIVPAFYLLSLVPDGIVKSGSSLRLTKGDELWKRLLLAGGDMLQATQALKEGGDTGHAVQGMTHRLLTILYEARDVCQDNGLPYPFDRALVQLIDAAHSLFPDDAVFLDFMPPRHKPIPLTPASAAGIPTVKLGNIQVPRLFHGLWQLSSPAWGTASEEDCDQAFSKLVSSGFTAFDMADHYADAELLFGRFRNALSPAELSRTVSCATKYCQFARIPTDEVVDREWVLEKVQERYDRLGGTIQLLQVHWQHMDDERYLDVFAHLVDIAETQPDLVRAIGLCNFDSATTARVCEHLKETKRQVGIVSNQVQYSLIDQRPRFAMSKVCEQHGIKLLTYGTFCGGFLSDKWLGKSEPKTYGGDLNTSQRKYLDVIRGWGGWDLFQTLLSTLRTIADVHSSAGAPVDISNVAARWVLQQPETGVVIIGSRLGVSEHIESSSRTLAFDLTPEDLEKIEGVLERSRAREMFEQMGDCGSEYR